LAGNPGGWFDRVWGGVALRTNHTPANIVKAAKRTGAASPERPENPRICKFFQLIMPIALT
jgi:hypothetical protein